MDRLADLLAKAATTLAAGDDLDTSVGQLLEIVAAATGSPFAAVTLQDPDRAELLVAVTFGAGSEVRSELDRAVASPTSPVATTATDRIARMGDGFIHLPLLVGRGGIDQLVGVLSLARDSEAEPDDEERTTLAAFAGLISVAIDRARVGSMVAERSEWFERMAHTDPLTGLANERTFSRILELELARAGRQGGEVSLAVFDVDDLTMINDVAGPGAGDDALRSVAAVLAESVRLVDTVARIGGDEFVLVAPGAAGMTVAQRVLDGVAALPATAGRRISLSAGVARFPTDGATAEDLRAAAETALAAARTAG
ncbi:MAG: sensor domain-containing diguanylate cyclase, partial [Chloroflexota bacterium]|nr:sensor domain-containing diguanylate cyclase [Chloroflexota bacterium]